MRWGLVPSWFKEDDPSKMHYSTSNCRSENILEKKSYKVRYYTLRVLSDKLFNFYQFVLCLVSDHCFSSKDPLLKGQRCVILADGFYEWKKQEKGKQPFFIYFPQTVGKKESQSDPMTSALNKKNSETASPDLVEASCWFIIVM